MSFFLSHFYSPMAGYGGNKRGRYVNFAVWAAYGTEAVSWDHPFSRSVGWVPDGNKKLQG